VVALGANVIAADRSWWTGQSVAFAQWCRDAGAGLLMVKPPVLGQTTPDHVVEHYASVSAVMPVMLVGRVSPEIMPDLAEQVPGILAFKDDVGGNYGFQVARHYATQWTLITSGHMWEHLQLWPYGAVGWLSNFIIFAPRVDRAYWTALEQENLPAAREIIFTYDEPWWDLAETFPGGADSLWHATLEVFGIAGRWRRSPYGAPAKADLARLRSFYQQLGLI
jgi:dihydrodipicolinate synthase/N-acetylneuraminate lyase